MLRAKGFPALLTLLILSCRLFAQSCGTDELHQYLLQHDAAYRESYHKFQQRADEQAHSMDAWNQRRALITIPVVVHVIHVGEPVGEGSNISANQILAALQGLNDRWRDRIGNSLDMEIEFCLAATDPDGNPTTGINRVNGAVVDGFADRGINWRANDGAGNADSLRSLSLWDHLRYYNIWVVHTIVGSAAGYANYPTNRAIEGTVIEARYMNYNYDVLTHELGHALNLRHTFDGDDDNEQCPDDTDCSEDGDRVCDTHPHKRQECAATGCFGVGPWVNTRYNYMSYCTVTDRFTQGQLDRVLAALAVSPRADLLNSNACEAAVSCDTIDCADEDACSTEICLHGVCLYEAEKSSTLSPFTAAQEREDAVQFSIGGKVYVGMGNESGTSTPLTDFWQYDPASDAWTRKADFPGTPRTDMVCFTIGDKGYVGLGNYNDTLYTEFWEYDDSLDAWTQLNDFPGSARKSAVGMSIGGKGYVGTGMAAGVPLADFWEYEPATATWTQKEDIPVARYNAEGFSLLGKGYIGLGSDTTVLSDFWEYDTVANTWTQKTDVPQLGAAHFNVPSAGYAVNGKGYFVTAGAVWEYAPSSEIWRSFYEDDLSAVFAVTADTSVYLGGGELDTAFISLCTQCSPPDAPGSITGDSIVCDSTHHQYSVTEVPGHIYLWTVPEGWQIDSGQGTATITVLPGDTIGFISVVANGGCYNSPSSKLAIAACPVETGVGSVMPEVQLFPNPNTGTFQVRFNDHGEHEITVTDVVGKVVLSPIRVRGISELSLDAPAGIYFLQIDKSVVRKFVVRGL